MIKISIITPVFNSIQYIQTCIENVIDQNCHEIEHIIVDGGSSDGTVDLIKEYASRYPHIKWISEKDKGQSDAMNKGIGISTGEYLSFLNVDDYYEKDLFKYVMGLFNNSNEKFYVGNCNIWDEKGQLMYISRPKDNTLFSCHFRQTYPINPSSYFYKKSLHDELGMYQENDHFGMDLDFFLRYMNLYKKYYYEDKVWGNFNVVDTCKTFNDNLNGNMMNRRNELFQFYWKQNNFILRYYYIVKNKIFKRY